MKRSANLLSWMATAVCALGAGCGVDERTLTTAVPDASLESGSDVGSPADRAVSDGLDASIERATPAGDADGSSPLAEGSALGDSAGSGGAGGNRDGGSAGSGGAGGNRDGGDGASLDAEAGGMGGTVNPDGAPSVCNPNPCVHGTCSSGDAGTRCICENGYSGTTCATNIDDCTPNPCQNGGVCVDRVASYSCDCTGRGFTGINCELARFQPLAFMLASGVYGTVTDVSADGATAVGTATDFGSTNAQFRWSVARGLEDFTPIVGSELDGVSGDGATLVGQTIAPASVYRWNAVGGRVSLPWPPTYTSCGVNGAKISADASTTVGICSGPATSAVRWKKTPGEADIIEVLPVPAGTTASEVRNVSADGSFIVGFASVSGQGLRAIRWTVRSGAPTVADDLGLLLNPGPYPTARGVSNDGVVVVGDDGTNAFRWTQVSGMQILPQPTPVDPNSNASAQDTSADGSVTVGFLIPRTGGFASDALVWNLSGGHRLRDLLLDAGVSAAALQGWVLGGASAVSADGKVIGGGGTNPSGQGQAWIARLP